MGLRLHADPQGSWCLGFNQSALLVCGKAIILSICGILCRSDGVVTLSGRHLLAGAALLADVPHGLGIKSCRRKPDRFSDLPAYPGLLHQRKESERVLGLDARLWISLWRNRFFVRTRGFRLLI